MVPVPPVMGLDLLVTPPPPLTSFTGCRSRTLMSLSFLIRRQTDRITLIFWACVSTPNYFVATFAFGWPTDPVVANILIALPLFEMASVLVCGWAARHVLSRRREAFCNDECTSCRLQSQREDFLVFGRVIPRVERRH